MEKEFNIQLTQLQAEFINTLMENGHSVQVFQKYERRKKAEKKLDDMYVAEFSLRPVKKVKKQNQTTQQKNLSYLKNPPKKGLKDIEKQKSQNNFSQKAQKKQNMNQRQTEKVSNQKGKIQSNEKDEQTKFRLSRSQRVSRPTQAYMQFQSETFKRKFVQKQEEKVLSVSESNKNLQKQKNRNGQKLKADQLFRTDNLIELKSLIAVKIQKKSQSKSENKLGLIKEQQTKLQKNIELNGFANTQQVMDQNNIESKTQRYFNQENLQEMNRKYKNQQNRQQRQNLDKNEEENAYTISAKRQSKQLKQEKSIKTEKQNNLLLSFQKQIQEEQKQMPQTRKSTLQKVHKSFLQLQMSTKKLFAQSKQSVENEKTPKNNQKLLNIKKIAKVRYGLMQKQPKLKKAWRILQKLRAHKSSWPFRYPVDPISQGVPDYLQRIKQPMDLKTIERKLRGQKYGSEEQFYGDVELMLLNSYQYNPRDSVYYKLTGEVQRFFRELRSRSIIMEVHGRKKSGMDSREQQEDQLLGEQQQEEEEIHTQEKQHRKKHINNEQNQQQVEKRQHLLQTSPHSNSVKRQRRHVTSGKQLITPQQQPSKFFVTNDNLPIKRAAQKQKDNIHCSSNRSGTKLQPTEGVVRTLSKPSSGSAHNQATMVNTNFYSKFDELNKLPLIKKQHLLYEILSLESEQSHQSLYEFIKNNQKMYQLLAGLNEAKEINGIDVTKQSNNSTQAKDQQAQTYQVKSLQQKFKEDQGEMYFEVDNLDVENYLILRAQVKKLMNKEKQIKEQNYKEGQMIFQTQHQKGFPFQQLDNP